MTTEIIILFFYCTGGIFVFNIVGKIIAPLVIKSGKPYFTFFIETVVGSVAVVTVFSLFKSHFVTINLIFFVLFFLLFLQNIKKNEINYAQQIKDRFRFGKNSVFFQIIFLSAVVLIASIIFPIRATEDDVRFYVKIAEQLGNDGKENVYHFYNDATDLFNGTTPYHYFDLWIGTFFFKLNFTSLADLTIFKYAVYVCARVMAASGFLTLIETFKTIKWFDTLLVVLLSLFDFFYITEFGFNDYPLHTSMWLRPNFIFYYIFLIPPFILLLQKENSKAVIFFLFLPVVSIATAPAVCSGVILFLLWKIIFEKENRVRYLKSTAIVAGIAAFMLLFYKITGISNDTASSENKSFGEMILYSLSIWKAILYYIVSLSARAILLMAFPLALLILLVKNGRKIFSESKSILWISFLITSSGIFLFQVFPFVDNTYQFPFVGYATCFTLIIYFIFQVMAQLKTNSRNFFLTIIVIVLFFVTGIKRISSGANIDFAEPGIAMLELKQRGLGEKYITELKHYFERSDVHNGGFLIAAEDLNEISLHSLTVQLGSYVSYLKSDLNLFGLTSPDILYSQKNMKEMQLKKAHDFNDALPFYKNFVKEKNNDYLKKFIDDNHIRFLILSRHFKREQLGFLNIQKEFTDTISGHQFLALEGSKN